MNIISRHLCHPGRSAKRGVERTRVFVFLILAFLLASCDFHGPWSYYPEEAGVYRGVYTHGYIIAGRTPYICFSKVYELDEAAAEDFAFYDSAHVTVTGNYGLLPDDSEVELSPVSGKPNCFATENDAALGVAGNSYTMDATFKWDSAGTKVTRTFKAVANIPTKVHARSIQGPSEGLENNNPHKENKYEYIEFDFLEFPFDMYTYNIAMEYDESVRGILTTLHYDNVNGGESQNTTMTSMFKGFLEPDSMGYYGMSTKYADETEAQFGYSARMTVGGINSLDTIMITGFSLPMGKNVIRFYATDQAYADYREKVLGSLEDSRVTAVTNVENGMGVFSGMLMDSLLVEVHSDSFIDYGYMFKADCFKEDKMMGTKPFSNKSCRLAQDSLCLDLATEGVSLGDVEHFDYNEACSSTILKLFLDEFDTVDNDFMPTYSAEEFNRYYEEAKMKFCIESGFAEKSFCPTYERECLESEVENDCNKALWEWCDDRDWNLEEFKQCGSALVNMVKVKKLKSPILERVAENWCQDNPGDFQCK